MPNIYRAGIASDGSQIAYHNSKGKKVTYNPPSDIHHSKYRETAVLLFGTVNKYFTKDSPNITPAEQVKLRADIAKAVAPLDISDYGDVCDRRIDVYKGMDFVLNTFSAKDSEGGANITPNEVYQMYEIFHSWTK